MSRSKAPPNTTILFQSAFKAHEQGRLEAAKIGYQQVLLVNKNHVDALHLLGLVCGQTGDLIEAEKWIRKAIALNENSIFWSNLGHILKNTQRPDKAEEAYKRALKLQPKNLDAHKSLSQLLHASKRLPDAHAAYLRYLELQPNDADAHNDLASLLTDCHRPLEAEKAYRRALELKPDYAQVHYNLGTLLYEGERMLEAEEAYRRALELKPDYAEAYANLGHLLHANKRFAQAEVAYQHALKIKPNDAKVFNSLGNLFSDCCRLDEAQSAYQRALELQPDYAMAHNNLASLVTQSRQNMAQAEAGFRRALELQPDYDDARLNLSLLLLLLQRYEEAWPLYEARYTARGKTSVTAPTLPFPQWQGQPLAGRSLVIWPEQGLGDYIQFVRYAPLLKAHGLARLTLLCRPSLHALLETLEGVDAVVTDMTQLEPHDYWCLVMSLPLHFETRENSIPITPYPYLRALPERISRWRGCLPETGLKVGLVWKGNPAQKNDMHRSLPGLEVLAPLWRVSGITFVSLQKGAGEEEAAHPPSGQPLLNLGTQFVDFADTAAVIEQLDLVISVCTSCAHLAGALGKQCWVLLPAIGSDWRWQLQRTDSPWYPSLRLFRQPDSLGWNHILDEMVLELTALAVQHGSLTKTLHD